MPHQLDLPKKRNQIQSGLKSVKIMILTQKRTFSEFSDRKQHQSRRTMAHKLRLRLLQMMRYASSIRFAEKNNSVQK